MLRVHFISTSLKSFWCAVSLAGLSLVAQSSTADSNYDSDSFTVALWGDQFYSENNDLKALRTQQIIDSINAHGLAFTLYTGDTKAGHSECTDQAIGSDIRKIFDALSAPTIYSLGDNEWTDCHRTSNGSYNPQERLDYLRTFFFSADHSQGKSPLTLTRQAKDGGAYSENSRLIKNGVMFVSLSIPGSNNNLVATEKQCRKESKRTAEDCKAATEEYQARNAANIQWLETAFEEARVNKHQGLVLLIQADIFFPFELSDGGFQDDFIPSLTKDNGYADFYKTLERQTKSFEGEVLLVHGDSHYFKIDKPMYADDGRLQHNFTRVQVFGDKDNSWVKLTIGPNSKNLFVLSPVILR
jgi:hypothetical protein